MRMMKAEIGVMLLHTKEHQRWPATPEAREEASSRFFLTAFGKDHSCQHVDLGLLGPELWDVTFLLFNALSLWYFIIEAPVN